MGMCAYFSPLNPTAAKQLRDQVESGVDANDAVEAQTADTATVDVDKSWHLIHYGLCGNLDTDDRLVSQAVLGGTEFGDDVGYGPLRMHDPDAVRKIAAELQAISDDDLIAMMKKRDWNDDVYCWHADEFDDLIDFAATNYLELRQAYLDAAEHGYWMLLYLA